MRGGPISVFPLELDNLIKVNTFSKPGDEEMKIDRLVDIIHPLERVDSRIAQYLAQEIGRTVLVDQFDTALKVSEKYHVTAITTDMKVV